MKKTCNWEDSALHVFFSAFLSRFQVTCICVLISSLGEGIEADITHFQTKNERKIKSYMYSPNTPNTSPSNMTGLLVTGSIPWSEHASPSFIAPRWSLTTIFVDNWTSIPQVPQSTTTYSDFCLDIPVLEERKHSSRENRQSRRPRQKRDDEMKMSHKSASVLQIQIWRSVWSWLKFL